MNFYKIGYQLAYGDNGIAFGKTLMWRRDLLAKYERIRGRKGQQAVYPLRGPSCGHCDTAIPLQRRNQMVNSGNIEVCEACGVLLYATP